MSNSNRLHLIAVALLAGSGAVCQAAVLAGMDPVAARNGLQADASAGAYQQNYNAVAGTLQGISFWGYPVDVAGVGTLIDNFDVLLNGTAMTGTWSTAVDGLLTMYTLDIPDVALAAGSGTLSVLNDTFDFEWYWQGATNASYSPTAPFPVAFRLIGDAAPSAVPEPGSLALVALAGLGLLAGARRKAAA